MMLIVGLMRMIRDFFHLLEDRHGIVETLHSFSGYPSSPHSLSNPSVNKDIG